MKENQEADPSAIVPPKDLPEIIEFITNLRQIISCLTSTATKMEFFVCAEYFRMARSMAERILYEKTRHYKMDIILDHRALEPLASNDRATVIHQMMELCGTVIGGSVHFSTKYPGLSRIDSESQVQMMVQMMYGKRYLMNQHYSKNKNKEQVYA